MAELKSGKFYRMPEGTVVKAKPLSDNWWGLTDVISVVKRPSTPGQWTVFVVAPDGQIYQGPYVAGLAEGARYGPVMGFTSRDLIEVIRSGMDVPMQDFYYWVPVQPEISPTPFSMQFEGLPDDFGEGYPGFEEADEGPAADDPVWAQALPAPPMLDVRGHEPNEDERRADLLADAARKPVRHLMQFDVFQSNFDDIVRPDEDGDCLFWSHTYELRRSDIVRVQFPVGYDRDNAVRALRKIADFIEEGVDLSGETP